MRTTTIRFAQMFWQRYLDVVLGAILVLAGGLKGQQLLADPSMGRAAGFPREVLIGAAAFELAFGCWLLAGLYRRLTRWMALAWFVSLAAVTLAHALGGVPSCACFGRLPTQPWLMFAFDVGAVVALWMWSPYSYSSRYAPAIFCLALLPAAAFLGLAGAARVQQPLVAEIDLRDIAQGGRKQHPFQCRNDSGVFVDVAAIQTSCSCLSLHLERGDVAAGQFLTGTATVDLSSKSGFVGALAIEAKGLTARGRVAFVLRIWAQVQPASQALKDSL